MQTRATPAGELALDDKWYMTSGSPDSWATPAEIPGDAQWIATAVLGTVAATLRDAGQFDILAPAELDGQDWWYRRTLDGEGSAILCFEGLATKAEVWFDGQCILRSDSMFLSHEVSVDLHGHHELALCFRALAPVLASAGTGRRARWRPKLVSPQSLRLVRTTLLGRMNGWCPPVHVVGPWRPVKCLDAKSLRLKIVRALATIEGSNGLLTVRLAANQVIENARLRCCDVVAPVLKCEDGVYEASLRIPDIALWWPHTHGVPRLHEIFVDTDQSSTSLGRTGFRTIAVDHGDDGKGFALRVNGVRVFCRGALWTNADLVALPCSRESYEPLLRLARDGGMNMVRVGGTMAYEARAFHELCDEFGILVWQDFMLSNMDYPAKDEGFLALIEAEARQLAQRTALSPSLAILCGGSEVMQQAAMMGLPESVWSNAIFEDLLPRIAAEHRPDVPYVPNTPTGGEMPFEPQSGLCHYYGVSAYMRPIEDARHAKVRFATECLGFANVPEGPVALEADRAAVVQPLWGEKYDRDVGAIWFFEDVRNHYLRSLYGIDPEMLRRTEPERYLDLSRAVNCALMESVFALWRRQGSPTGGGLVWFLRDLSPGAGYGVIDAGLEPKSVWYGLRRAFRPVQVLLVDEGLNGLVVHVINEPGIAFHGEVELACLRDGEVRVMQAKQLLHVPAHDSITITAISMWGAFFDTNYAYRFGEPSHDVTVARLRDATGVVVAEAFHFPLGQSVGCQDIGLEVKVIGTGDRRKLAITTQRFARSVHIVDRLGRAADNWFHLAPGEIRIVDLLPRNQDEPIAAIGTVTAMNTAQVVTYGNPA